MSDGNSRGAYSLSYNWSESSGPNSQGTGSVTVRRSGTQGQVQNRRNPVLEVQPRIPPRRVVPVDQVQFPVRNVSAVASLPGGTRVHHNPILPNHGGGQFDRHSVGPGLVYQGHHEQQGTMSPSNSTISSRGSVRNNNGSVGGGSRRSTRGSTRGSYRSTRGSATRNTLFPQANQFHRNSSGQPYHGGPARQQSRSLQQVPGGFGTTNATQQVSRQLVARSQVNAKFGRATPRDLSSLNDVTLTINDYDVNPTSREYKEIYNRVLVPLEPKLGMNSDYVTRDEFDDDDYKRGSINQDFSKCLQRVDKARHHLLQVGMVLTKYDNYQPAYQGGFLWVWLTLKVLFDLNPLKRQACLKYLENFKAEGLKGYEGESVKQATVEFYGISCRLDAAGHLPPDILVILTTGLSIVSHEQFAAYWSHAATSAQFGSLGVLLADLNVHYQSSDLEVVKQVCNKALDLYMVYCEAEDWTRAKGRQDPYDRRKGHNGYHFANPAAAKAREEDKANKSVFPKDAEDKENLKANGEYQRKQWSNMGLTMDPNHGIMAQCDHCGALSSTHDTASHSQWAANPTSFVLSRGHVLNVERAKLQVAAALTGDDDKCTKITAAGLPPLSIEGGTISPAVKSPTFMLSRTEFARRLDDIERTSTDPNAYSGVFVVVVPFLCQFFFVSSSVKFLSSQVSIPT
ncbi:hypothetical protein THAOC_18635, partial [Thalassiosira oceanica]